MTLIHYIQTTLGFYHNLHTVEGQTFIIGKIMQLATEIFSTEGKTGKQKLSNTPSVIFWVLGPNGTKNYL